MISLFKAQGFGCLNNVQVELTPLHALIGPNDSGKSTLLHAIDTMGHFAKSESLHGVPHHRFITESRGRVRLEAQGSTTCIVEGNSSNLVLTTIPPGELGNGRTTAGLTIVNPPDPALGLGGIRILRLDPDAMRQPSSLMPLDKPELFFSQRGRGLSGFLGGINLRGDVEPISRIQSAVHSLFPAIQRVGSVPVNSEAVALEAVLVDGTRVQAAEISVACHRGRTKCQRLTRAQGHEE